MLTMQMKLLYTSFMQMQAKKTLTIRPQTFPKKNDDREGILAVFYSVFSVRASDH